MGKHDTQPMLREFQGEEATLAQELLALRQSPSPSLQRRLQAIPHHQKRSTSFHLAWSVAGLILVVGLLFVSSPAQATLGGVEQLIGHIHLAIQDTYQPVATATVVASVSMSLPEARSSVPYTFAVPTHLPKGLQANAEVSVLKLEMPIVKLRWTHQSRGFVQLTAHPFSGDNLVSQTLVGGTGHKAIQINDQSAALIYGAWDATSQTWQHQPEITTLVWVAENIQYRLLAVNTDLEIEDLVGVAASVR